MMIQPGRELDAKVAEALGWQSVTFRRTADNTLTGKHPDGYIDDVPYFSTDIAAAWSLVDELQEGRNDLFTRLVRVETFYPGYVEVEINTETAPDSRQWVEIFVWGETAPHAICLAFLKSKGIDLTTPPPSPLAGDGTH